MRTAITRVLTIAVLVATVALSQPWGAAGAATSFPPVRRVLIVSLPRVRWADLDLARLPNLRALLDASALGSTSLRGVEPQPTLADGYVTISAGTRAQAVGLDDGACDAACAAMPEIVRHNHHLLYGAEPGLLARTLHRAGVTTAVVGGPLAALALAEPDGMIEHPAIGARAPDAAASTDAFRRRWAAPRAVVLVEDSELANPPASRALDVRAALVRFDTVLGPLLRAVDPAHDAVMVIAPVSPPGRAQITIAALRSPGTAPGDLRSAYTRRRGVVSIVDVAPTVLALLDIARPGSMEGRPWEAVGHRSSLASAVDGFVDENSRAVFRDSIIAGVTVFFVVAQVVLVGAAILLLRRRTAHRTAAIEIAAYALLVYPLTTYLAGLLPFDSWGALAYWSATLAASLAAGAVLYAAAPRGTSAVALTLAAVCAFFAVDLVTGGHLQYNTAFGYTPTIGGRFSGLGNLGYSLLAAAAVLLAGFVAHRIGGRHGARVAIVVLFLAIVVDGAPFFGSDVGGVLSMVPAFAVTAVMLLGRRIRPRVVVWTAAATVGAIVLAGVIDMTRPADHQTHLGRLINSVRHNGWGDLWLTIHRKLDENTTVLFSSIFSLMLPIVFAGVAYLVYKAPGRLRGLQERIPPLRASLAGLGLVALLGFALNDSGIAIPGVMLGVLTPVAVIVLDRIDRDALDETVDEPIAAPAGSPA